MSIGFNFPFAPATGSLGYLEVTDDVISSITANLRSLLLTNRGERVMHVDFGCNFREFIFEQKSKSLRSRIAERVTSQVAKWMPFITMTALYVSFSDEDSSIPENGFHIHIDFVYGNIPVNFDQSFSA